MTERIPKSAFVTVALMALLVLPCLAYFRPWYFASQTYIGVLIFLEFLIAAVWLYRRVFFPVVLIAFLFSGINLPVSPGFWAMARWGILALGAMVGCLIILKERSHHFGLFHILASFAVLTSLVSVSVSRYSGVALLKVLSIFLLFLYAGTGARIAAAGRENRFFAGLLIGCEVFVGANAVFYAMGIEAMGNPNSLGAVMGIVGAPILLWGALLDEKPAVRWRRWLLYAICMYLDFNSHARAGLAAALLSSGLLCLALRRYKLLIPGSVVILILVGAIALFRPGTLSSIAFSAVYKGGTVETGVLASRQSTWQAAVERIRDNLWFGTGLGTTANGKDASENQGSFASSSSVTAENGSSYLAVTAGVGVLGALPFFLLLLFLINKVLRTVSWVLQSGCASHPAVPLAMVVFAGMIHAGFEDWMFAPGNYMCVFFWSMAFVFVDFAPFSTLLGFLLRWHPVRGRALGGVTPN